MIDSHIFREYDIRGDVRTQLTSDVAGRIGHALAMSHFPIGSELVVGRDARTHSPDIQHALMSGLNALGVYVTDLGQITTPMLYFALFKRKCDGGVMVTGSHNPVNDNGLKICRGTESFVRKDIEAVRDIVMDEKDGVGQGCAECTGQTKSLDIAGEYEREILERVKPGRRIKIVIDAGNGVAGPYAKSLFAHYASELTCLYCEPDGTFPHHHPDPSVAKNLADLQKAVIEKGADLGLAFDGDGDRLGVVDKNGHIIPADHLIILFAREILGRNRGATILGDVKCSKQTFDEIRLHGGDAVMTKTGHALIKAKIRETHAALAGEMSGHFFFGDRWFGFDDALYAGARMVEIAANAADKGLSVSDLLADLLPTHATPELRIDCPDDLKFDLSRAMYELYSQKYPTSDLDGARIDFPNGWALIRASNTQPVIVMRVEADSVASGNAILEDLTSNIRAFAGSRGVQLCMDDLRMDN
ncbi:MAG: phosphomannomutase/phosphoglucomutase [Proteobacteria bacterium]|nr:phosphomannomutase/phosphoglucomutase [Pseudomonadota bacterium]